MKRQDPRLFYADKSRPSGRAASPARKSPPAPGAGTGKLTVISGTYRGRKLAIPPGARPTQQRARAAVMNMLGAALSGAAGGGMTVWDAFAGSGAMGIEFISRFGARRAIFTDTDAGAIKCLRRNTENIPACDILIKPQSASGFVHELRRDTDGLIIFIDPPYSVPKAGAGLVEKLSKTAPAGAIVVWELESGAANAADALDAADGFEVLRDRVHGRARFLILRKLPALPG